jgi:hypothetical protein
MFRLFARARQAKGAPPRFRPRLERLEERDCPSVITANVTYDQGTYITVWGTVRGSANPRADTVTISGVASGTTVCTDLVGSYSVTLKASGLGTVYAQATDSTNQASITLVDTAPVITSFTAVEHPGDMWTFSGTVSYDCHPEQLVINLAGIPSLNNVTANVNANGTWSVTVQLNGTYTDNGTISAVTTDPWGNASNTMYAVVQQTGT